MNVVLFCGAGFSAPFGMPTMTDFLRAVQTSERIAAEDRTLIGQLILEARNANSFVESAPDNLEALLSIAVMGDRLGIPCIPHAEASRSARVISILRKMYSDPGNAEQYWSKYKMADKFLHPVLKEPSEHMLTVVTTNYDINIESVLFAVRKRTRLSFPVEDAAFEKNVAVRGKLYSTDSGIPVLKLHGSVNWYRIPGNEQTVKIEGRVVSVGHGQLELPLVCAESHVPDGEVIIVPPSFLKPELTGPLKNIWKLAAQALGEAHIVAFVGYSFPTTDTEMRFFLARALSSNPNLQRIDVFDLSAKAIVERLRNSSSGYGSHFRQFLRAYEGDWRDMRLKL